MSLLLGGAGLLAQEPTAAGQWTGSIGLPNAPLPIVVRIDRGADGTWSGTMDIPAQGLIGGKLSGVTVEARSVRFTLAGVPGNPTFAGTLTADGGSITGDFTQGAGKFPFALARAAAGAAPAHLRPQEPKPPYPYDVVDVTVPNTAAGISLAGTLTVPRAAGPHAAVVLISGSGAQDRDSTLFGHKPFLLLADYLTRKGVAVLRLDDRGVGGSTGNPATATSEDLAGDVAAAVAFLAARPGINAALIGLIGHSEGGLIAPLAALRSKSIAFLVLMAGPGETGERIMLQQAALIARGMGATEGQIAANRAIQEQAFSIVKTEAEQATRRERLRAVVGDAQATQAATPWFKFFLTYDPAATLRQITVPTLALAGEKDLQVPAKENLAAIEAALRAGGNTQFTIRSFPDLNHLFQTAKTGLPNEYGEIEETMAPVVLETLADWIGRR